MKARRHRMIAAILQRDIVTNQAQLSAALLKQGERVTQATLSRDLEELGASKARRGNGVMAYALPEEPPGSGEHLRRMLVEFLRSATASGNLVVLRTPPGCAQPVARALDTASVRDVIGTVAGDDTILVICRESVAGRTVARRLEALAGGVAAMKEA